MKRAILCAATLLLASGAWGQHKDHTKKLSTYHVQIIWQGNLLCCVTVQEPPHTILGVDTSRTFALEDATHATVWTDAEWKKAKAIQDDGNVPEMELQQSTISWNGTSATTTTGPAPHWQDMGPVHLYNATCPAGYTYEQIAPGWIAGQPMYIANPDQQISATEMPTNTPAGTCVKEKP